MLGQPLKKIVLPFLTVSMVIVTALAWGQQPTYAPPAQGSSYNPAGNNNADQDNDPNATAEEAFASHWPMEVDSPQGKVSVFQPQLEELQGDTLSARAAVSLIPAGQTDPVFGAVWFKSRISTDRVARMVTIVDTDVTQVRFPNADPAVEKNLETTIEQSLKSQPMDLSLDQLLSMVEIAHKEDSGTTDLENDAPKVMFSDHPTVKIQYDGEPRFSDVKDSNLKRAENTPFFVVMDPNSNNCYLKGAGLWFASASPLGPFQRIPRAPDPVAALADAENYKDPQEKLPDEQVAKLEIVTATDPTELIWSDGPIKMGTISGTNLLYVTNTDSDVFTLIDSQQVYILLSGRWYTAPNRNGPWTFVPPDKLPPDFSKIPPHSDQGDVLAHVAGTQEAMDAVADTYVPQTAAIDRTNFDQPPIEYDGDPRFEAVGGSIPCGYAVNTTASVMLVDGRYYSCNNAVWFTSAFAAGPWQLCTAVPPVIYQIPASCPIYPVRYCYVYNTTPSFIYCGYTPGYIGCYTYNHVVVYGTGYHYHPWVGHYYCARPYTFGFAAHYNSYVNHWGFSFGLATGGGSLWIGIGGVEDDHRWTHREEPWFGCGGYRPVVIHREVHEDIFRREYVSKVHVERSIVIDDRKAVGGGPVIVHRDTFGRDVYDRRKDVRTVAAVAAKPAIARVNPPSRVLAAPADRGARGPIVDATPAARGEAPAARNINPNRVLAGRDGNVYRRANDGSWEVRDNKGQWAPSSTPPAAPRGGQDAGPAARRGAGSVNPITPEPPAPARGNNNPPTVSRGEPAARSNAPDTPDRGRDTGRGARADRGNAAADRGNGKADDKPNSDLDRDYNARVNGNNRLRNYRGPADSPKSDTPSRGADRGNADRGNAADRGNSNNRGR